MLAGNDFLAMAQQMPAAAATYEQVMNGIAQPQLERRKAAMEKVQTREQADARKAWVRATLLRLMGGLPGGHEGKHDPLNATVVGTLPEDGFRIEKIIYDSLPGYHVTANLYLPASGKGPFPVVIYSSGHAPFGKGEAYGLGSYLARNGIAVFAYDPLGAGERLQAKNPATGKSWAGPDEHSQAEIPISLIGDHVARYMIWDAMRGIDYLATRPDIDAKNIGSYGCSGGGTLSAYLTALDDRVKAGVVAFYLTSYEELLKGQGPQDGEQVIPNSIETGLDFADLVELAAPRAYAMVSTTEDMFPFAGARAVHDEAERFYSLYGAGENLQWFAGPGGHGAIFPLMPKIAAFYRHWLANDDSPVTEMGKMSWPKFEDLWCTPTGQVTTALKGRSIYEINREQALAVLPKKTAITTREQLTELQARLRKEIPLATGMGAEAVRAPELTVTGEEQRAGYRMQTIVFHSRYGMELPAMLALPDKQGPKAALLMTSYLPVAARSEFDRAAKSGMVVLLMTPLPWPKATNEDKPTLGPLLPWASRALLVGKTFVGMRTEDMLAAVEWLAENKEVNPAEIDAYAEGASCVALLHAAALDSRIRRITLEHSLGTLQSVVDADVHRNVVESVIPNVLLHYDLDDLRIAIAPREITERYPVNADGSALTQSEFEAQLARVYAADEAMGMGERIRFLVGDGSGDGVVR